MLSKSSGSSDERTLSRAVQRVKAGTHTPMEAVTAEPSLNALSGAERESDFRKAHRHVAQLQAEGARRAAAGTAAAYMAAAQKAAAMATATAAAAAAAVAAAAVVAAVDLVQQRIHGVERGAIGLKRGCELAQRGELRRALERGCVLRRRPSWSGGGAQRGVDVHQGRINVTGVSRRRRQRVGVKRLHGHGQPWSDRACAVRAPIRVRRARRDVNRRRGGRRGSGFVRSGPTSRGSGPSGRRRRRGRVTSPGAGQKKKGPAPPRRRRDPPLPSWCG